MNTSTCSECHRVFSNGGEHGWFSGTCPDCIRQKKGQAEASRQAAAVIASSESQTHAAWHAANATAEAAHQTASAQVEALRREADAKERLLDAQAAAALANSVGQLSAEGLQRVHEFKRLEEDRANLQALFDKIGNCASCIEGKGSATEHFKIDAYDSKQLNSRDAQWGGIPATYRYFNLRACIAQLRDLREETNRIRSWDSHISREALLARIAEVIDLGQQAMTSAAKASVKHYRGNRWKRTLWYIMLVCVASTGFGLLLLPMIAVWMPIGWTQSNDWDEIVERSIS